jgi:hypothetical protein
MDTKSAPPSASQSPAGNAIWQAVKRTPGLIAGSGVDAANLALGLLAGKGLDGLSAKPVGGGEWINEQFGMSASKDALQAGTEAALSMLSPGGAAKAAVVGGGSVLGMLKILGAGGPAPKGVGASQRGIIAVGTPEVADILNITDVVDRAKDMKAAGKSAFSIEQESMNALANKRNPGGAFVVFMGPEGLPRIKIDPAVAQLNPTFEKSLKTTYREATLPKTMWAPRDSLVGPETLLSDLLYHPSLYDISPAARTMTVQNNAFTDIFGTAGGYSPSLNTLILPKTTYSPARNSNDPVGTLIETLLHEATHGIQAENKTRGGGSSTIESIKRVLEEAKTMGSYRTPEQLATLENYVKQLETAPDSTARTNALSNLYLSNYGEFEARLGSQYGKSFPSQVERKATY